MSGPLSSPRGLPSTQDPTGTERTAQRLSGRTTAHTVATTRQAVT